MKYVIIYTSLNLKFCQSTIINGMIGFKYNRFVKNRTKDTRSLLDDVYQAEIICREQIVANLAGCWVKVEVLTAQAL